MGAPFSLRFLGCFWTFYLFLVNIAGRLTLRLCSGTGANLLRIPRKLPFFLRTPFSVSAFRPQEGTEANDMAALDTSVSIEKTYQKVSQLEHIQLRPDTYIGSDQAITEQKFVLVGDRIVQKEITYVPGLLKIFDEILVNASDHKVNWASMDTIKIDIDAAEGKIRIYNNGDGIPVTMHKTENMYVPTMIFGHLMTSTNFNDEKEKVTGGRNGLGAKLCNVFSSKFIVETSSKKYKKEFKQQWGNNMGKTS